MLALFFTKNGPGVKDVPGIGPTGCTLPYVYDIPVFKHSQDIYKGTTEYTVRRFRLETFAAPDGVAEDWNGWAETTIFTDHREQRVWRRYKIYVEIDR